MLSKVSLLDSLDSTMGSNKVGTSKDREREMNTIHEVDSHNQGMLPHGPIVFVLIVDLSDLYNFTLC